MEPPDDWDFLTACLACLDLHDEARAWALVTAQGLVRPEGHARFVELVRHERDRVITGPSPPYRVASALRREGLCTPAAAARDPGATRARALLGG